MAASYLQDGGDLGRGLAFDVELSDLIGLHGSLQYCTNLVFMLDSSKKPFRIVTFLERGDMPMKRNEWQGYKYDIVILKANRRGILRIEHVIAKREGVRRNVETSQWGRRLGIPFFRSAKPGESAGIYIAKLLRGETR